MIGGPLPDRNTSARQRVIKVLEDGEPRTAKYLANHAKVSLSVIHRLVAIGCLKRDCSSEKERPSTRNWEYQENKLSTEQNYAAQILKQRIIEGTFGVTL